MKSNNILFPSGVKIIILINVIVFLLMEISGEKNLLFQVFGLIPSTVITEFKLWQTVTYLFIHGGYLHIIFNMFVLWIFGKDLEHDWGKNDFLIFYFLCGVGAGVFTVLSNINSFIPIVGASGAIYGLLVAYGFSYPNRVVYLYGIFPLQVKYLVTGLGIIAFVASLSTHRSNVSHITHLSGMIIGIVYIIVNFKLKNIHIWYIKQKLKLVQNNSSLKNQKKKEIKIEVDQLLDKINNNGWDSLSAKEETFLKNASKKIFNNDKSPN